MKPVNSLSDLAALFGEIPHHSLGCWFLIEEAALIKTDGRPFAHKPGSRPVVLARKPGPNAIVYPRSTTVPGGFPHEPHVHATPGCPITKSGYVQTHIPITLRTSLLGEEAFTCFEPESSPLLEALAKGRP